MLRFSQIASTWILIATLMASASSAGDYYTKVPFLPTVIVGSSGEGATPANEAYGKEYSHNDWLSVYHALGDPNLVSVADHDAFGVADPLQVVSWDGIAAVGRAAPNSGSVNAFDYGVPGFNFPSGQVDALANRGDFLFRQVVLNQAALLFSMTGDLDASTVLPPAGGGSTAGIVYKDHVHYEAPIGPGAGVGIGHGTWAPIEAPTSTGPGVNHHTVVDLDGLEVWGPEPPSHNNPANPTPVVDGYIGGLGGALTADSNRFSLDLDSGSGTSIWAYNTTTGGVAPWVLHSEIVAAVEKLFLPAGFRFDDETRRSIDVDALMTSDLGVTSPTAPPLWDPGDELLFSIDPIAGMMLDPSGAPSVAPPIDGGEVIHVVKTAAGAGPATLAVAFLSHGGHLWNTAFPVATTFGYFYEDLDALEAVGVIEGDRVINTPEPTSAMLMIVGLAAFALAGRRRI
jgi:hypothetical protein